MTMVTRMESVGALLEHDVGLYALVEGFFIVVWVSNSSTGLCRPYKCGLYCIEAVKL